MKKLLISIAILSVSLSVFSQTMQREMPTTRILFILDCSNSMNAKWENNQSKMDVARPLLAGLLDSLAALPNIKIALRMYGHQSPVPPQDCSDTRLEVPFSDNNIQRIKQKLWQVTPKGTTPIARSLAECEKDFPPCDNCRNIVILITDGIEACDGDPCAIALGLEKKGIILKPYIIGIGLDVEFIEAFNCIEKFYNASSSSHLKEIFEITISETIVSTTAQVNLLDIYGKPTETNVNMTFFDSKHKNVKHNYIHTLNKAGRPDTLILDPLYSYDLKIHTIPPVSVNNIELTEGKHNVIQAKTPQGQLLIKEKDGNRLEKNNVQYIIRESDEYNTLHVQPVNELERLIVGNYDIEVLTLPRTNFYNVRIDQSKLTTLTIDAPGVVNVAFPHHGQASLYVIKDDKPQWIYNLNNNLTYNLLLQPGNYMIVYRSDKVKLTTGTVYQKFEVKPGYTQYVDFR